jgi:pimeloyl-ACP methyl ester carboxylesterase
MPFEHINGMKIYYEIHGSGDTIVLLHHGFGCTKIWKDIYPRFVEKGYRVVMYDRRGYGQSERGDDFEEFYISDTFRFESVKELAILKELLNIDSFHIIGQCEGGVVGIDYAAMYPHHVTTIVVSSTQCYSKMTMQELNSLKFPDPFQELESEIKKN